ncbi:HPP family protein [Elusimicrobiota bacterium]
MLKAKDIMTTEKIFTIGPDEILDEAIKKLVKNKVSGVPVVDENKKVIGMISEKDILNFMFSGNVKQTKVSEAMSTNVTMFSPDTDIDKISLVMGEKKIRRVPIVEDGKLVGIISRRSIIRIVLDMGDNF